MNRKSVDPALGHIHDATVDAVHQKEQALKWMERAWGCLLECHHNVGHAQLTMLDAVDKLDVAGHGEMAHSLRTTVATDDVLPGRWTYQVVDEFRVRLLEATRRFEADLRERLAGGVRHRHEARQKAKQQPAATTTVDLGGLESR